MSHILSSSSAQARIRALGSSVSNQSLHMIFVLVSVLKSKWVGKELWEEFAQNGQCRSKMVKMLLLWLACYTLIRLSILLEGAGSIENATSSDSTIHMNPFPLRRWMLVLGQGLIEVDFKEELRISSEYCLVYKFSVEYDTGQTIRSHTLNVTLNYLQFPDQCTWYWSVNMHNFHLRACDHVSVVETLFYTLLSSEVAEKCLWA